VVRLEFKFYIESKLRKVLNDDKKQGRRRDIDLLTGIVNALFWARCYPNRSVYDILPMLSLQYKNMKKDTLEDNLEFLAKVPIEEPILKISSEKPRVEIYTLNASINPIDTVQFDKHCKPRNIYTLNDYYLRDYYEKDVGIPLVVRAAIACKDYDDPQQCPDPNCKICEANGKKTCWDQAED
jgi:hypothetical protein